MTVEQRRAEEQQGQSPPRKLQRDQGTRHPTDPPASFADVARRGVPGLGSPKRVQATRVDDAGAMEQDSRGSQAGGAFERLITLDGTLPPRPTRRAEVLSRCSKAGGYSDSRHGHIAVVVM